MDGVSGFGRCRGMGSRPKSGDVGVPGKASAARAFEEAHYRAVELPESQHSGARGRPLFLSEEQRAPAPVAGVCSRQFDFSPNARNRPERPLSRWIAVAGTVDALAEWTLSG